MDWSKRVRKAVLKLKPYVPGKPIEEVQRELGLEDVIKLASNENPIGPSPKAIEAAMKVLSEAHRYPDDSYYRLRQKLASIYNVPTDWVLLGRGSDEILLHIVQTFVEPGDEVVFSSPSFIMYEILSNLMDAVCVKVPLNNYIHDVASLLEAITERTKIVFIDNPNNPTGTILRNRLIKTFLDETPEGVLVVLDEAYAEFVEAKDFPNSLDYVREGYPVIVLRTFSKAYGLAGLRIGYGFARSEITQHLFKVREPFNVSSVAAAAAESALDDKEFLDRVRKTVWTSKRLMYRGLEKLGLQYVPTEANFVLVNVNRKAKDVSDALLKKGIIVRPCEPFGLPTHLRVDIGTPEIVERFLCALEEVLKSSK
ncbi:MAG: histidinol-phosphate transaminase [Armatimonadetes bacterium]|nr:histidinol-phosphate transaminase [Armatimonadota bacterium]MDW8028720.1 histidinol-phosphate transaminase [Armatimonadota bacterium]